MDAKVLQAIFTDGLGTVMFKIYKQCWCAETCRPDRRVYWSPSNPAFGQADVTALVLQDMVGGDIMSLQVVGAPHYYNRLLDGSDLDLTESQFHGTTPIPRHKGVVIAPKDLLAGVDAARLETKKRFNLLADSAFDALYEVREYWDNNTTGTLFP